MKPSELDSVLFFRHFNQFSGGHQKVYDYFNHVISSANFSASISFSTTSLWDETNPWFPKYKNLQVKFDPHQFDCLFLAGMDWKVYIVKGAIADKPVINLIQGVRHALPGEDVHPYLKQKAIRICVSSEVSAAISSTGLVRGPIITIPNGVQVPDFNPEKTNHVLISGLKNPQVAKDISQQLSKHGFQVRCQLDQVPRDEYLKLLASAEISILLPSPTEGFYLPALESMKLARITIVPDCVGNRGFCFGIEDHPTTGNCFAPEYAVDAIVSSCTDAEKLLHSKDRLEQIRHNALATVAQHSLQKERQAFLEILNSVEELWANI